MANNFVEQFWKLMKGGGGQEEELRRTERDYMLSLCSDVRTEKDRLGGDWAVASVVRTREERDIMRSVLDLSLDSAVTRSDQKVKRRRQ